LARFGVLFGTLTLLALPFVLRGPLPADAAPILDTVVRASVSSAGAAADATSGDSPGPSITADGRYVAFSSQADNLVAGDGNGSLDIFVRDLVAGTTTLVSATPSGTVGGSGCFSCAIAAGGRYVAFDSYAEDLVPSDTNEAGDVFLRDLDTGITTCVSVNASGVPSARSTEYVLGLSGSPSISSNGRYVAFSSASPDLDPNDTNDSFDVFVRDVVAGTTVRADLGPGGVQGNDSYNVRPSLSGDGRYVAFESMSTNMVAHDTNEMTDIFVRDLQAGVTTRVSVGPAGVQSNGWSLAPSISADGRFVAFDSDASNLVTGDTNKHADVFVRDRQTGTTSRVSVDTFGAQADGDSYSASISADGRYVAYRSDAPDLVAGDTNGVSDIFVRDRLMGTTVRMSVDASGTQGNGPSESAALAPSGLSLAFQSAATNLVPNDTNGVADVFVNGAPSVATLAWVRTPIAPAKMYRWKSYNVYGYLKPRHTAGSYPVRIYKWKRTTSGKWKSYGYVKARASNYSTYTKYARSVRLPYKGTWRLRAYAPADAAHPAAWSTGYDYVTVR
jgi:Tol biopolymer transport system component